MAFVIQDPDDPTDDANAYIAVLTFQTYHDARGNDYSSFEDTDVEEAIVRATDYIDSRWTFAGARVDADQSTECPRSGVCDLDSGLYLNEYPPELEEACAEYAFSALSTSLYPESNVDNSGRSVKLVRKKLAVIERETEYFHAGGTAWKSYPLADGKMQKTGLLIAQRRTLGRG